MIYANFSLYLTQILLDCCELLTHNVNRRVCDIREKNQKYEQCIKGKTKYIINNNIIIGKFITCT